LCFAETFPAYWGAEIRSFGGAPTSKSDNLGLYLSLFVCVFTYVHI